MKTRNAFTIVETVITVFLVMLTMILMFNVTLQSGRMAQKVSTDTSNLADARAGLEKVVEDIKQADLILTQYPTTGPVCTTQSRDCLILRIPRIDNNANRMAGLYDVVIYRVIHRERVTATADTANVYNLERWTGTITPSSQSRPRRESIAATNIVRFGMDFGAVEQFRGDGYQTEWGLRTTPLSSTAEFRKEINIAGIDWATAGFGQFVAAGIKFERAPKWGVPIDVTYPVNPTLITNPDGGNAANVVDLVIRFRNETRNARNVRVRRVVEFNSRAHLRNF